MTHVCQEYALCAACCFRVVSGYSKFGSAGENKLFEVMAMMRKVYFCLLTATNIAGNSNKVG